MGGLSSVVDARGYSAKAPPTSSRPDCGKNDGESAADEGVADGRGAFGSPALGRRLSMTAVPAEAGPDRGQRRGGRRHAADRRDDLAVDRDLERAGAAGIKRQVGAVRHVIGVAGRRMLVNTTVPEASLTRIQLSAWRGSRRGAARHRRTPAAAKTHHRVPPGSRPIRGRGGGSRAAPGGRGAGPEPPSAPERPAPAAGAGGGAAPRLGRGRHGLPRRLRRQLCCGASQRRGTTGGDLGWRCRQRFGQRRQALRHGGDPRHLRALVGARGCQKRIGKRRRSPPTSAAARRLASRLSDSGVGSAAPCGSRCLRPRS